MVSCSKAQRCGRRTGGLGNAFVHNERGLDFGRGQAVAGDVDDVYKEDEFQSVMRRGVADRQHGP